MKSEEVWYGFAMIKIMPEGHTTLIHYSFFTIHCIYKGAGETGFFCRQREILAQIKEFRPKEYFVYFED